MNHKKRVLNIFYFSFIILILSCSKHNEIIMDQIPVIPYPNSVVKTGETFNLDNRTRIWIDEASRPVLERMAKILNTMMVNTVGARLEVTSLSSRSPQIILKLNHGLQLGREGYHLRIDKKQILIEGESIPGVFYGIQTLRQILPVEVSQSVVQIGGMDIYDRPRFPWRGLLLDVSRHYMPLNFIKKYLDYMAMHKLNTFHWHLTDDQGWRIEIKKYPRLTEIGAWRDEKFSDHYNKPPPGNDSLKYGGYYTQADIKEIVAYAAERGITIVPEIELPGHAQAAIAAYPELGVTGETIAVKNEWGISPYLFNVDESTFEFIKNVLTEVISLFPGEFIHIGGDEAIKDQWKRSEEVQARMKELHIENEQALQNWFIERIDSFLVFHHKRLIGWDEILEGELAHDAAIMSWRGVKRGIEAARTDHDVVMTPTDYCYFDYYQAEKDHEPHAICEYLPLTKVYGYDPVPEILSPEEAGHILGVQANLWTEYMDKPEQVEYMLFPRIAALSEIAWTQPSNKNWSGFRQRLEKLVKIYENQGINYSRTGLDY
jgi:hexosaminidase